MIVFRELQEEAGVLSHDLSKIGLLEFEFVGEPTILQVHVFTTTSYIGLPTESDGQFMGSLIEYVLSR